MALVKVLVADGFSTVNNGAYGPGEQEMERSVAEKFSMFVTILETKKAKQEDKPPAKPEVKEYKKEDVIPKAALTTNKRKSSGSPRRKK